MTDNTFLVSVCISVYNGEKYLRKCLNSVAEQDIDSMEIVLVDDGSTDNTLLIMKEYKAQYPEKSIKIIHQKHSGLAQGRWTCVHNSAGEYITFLDADDYLLKDAYKTIKAFMANYSIDIYEFQTIREEYYSKSPYSGVMDAKKVLKDYFNGVGMPVNYWLRWFRKDLFTEQMFPKMISLHEDVYAFPCILSRARTIAYIDKPLHVHTKDNKASIMNAHYEDRENRDYFERQKILLLSIPHIEKNIDQLNTTYKDAFLNYKLRIYINFLFMDVKGISYKEKLYAIIETLNLDMNTKELERYISRCTTPNSKMNCMVRYLGLHNAYRIYRLIK